MPTKLPRLNVTVTEEQHAMLREIGGFQNRSAASFLREMLDTLTPSLQATLPFLRDASRMSDELKARMAQAPDATRKALEPAAEAIDVQMDLIDSILANALPEALRASTDDAGAARSEDGRADRTERRAREDRTASAATTQPPYSNTGVSSEHGENIGSSSAASE